MTKVETETGQMITALRDGVIGLHIARMALVAESKALRRAGRRAELDKVLARVEEITAQIEVTNRDLAEHMLRADQIDADKAWNAVKAAEKAWIAAAKKRTPEEWRKAIDGIADKLVRIQAACIVWCDFFSSRPASDPWPHLDDLRWAWKADHNADGKKVSNALMQVGYPERIADRRGCNDMGEPDTKKGERK